MSEIYASIHPQSFCLCFFVHLDVPDVNSAQYNSITKQKISVHHTGYLVTSHFNGLPMYKVEGL